MFFDNYIVQRRCAAIFEIAASISLSPPEKCKRKVVSPDIKWNCDMMYIYNLCRWRRRKKTASVANCFRFCFHFVLNSKVLVENASPLSFFAHSLRVCVCVLNGTFTEIETEHLRSVHMNGTSTNKTKLQENSPTIQWLLASNRNTIKFINTTITLLQAQQLIGWYSNQPKE